MASRGSPQRLLRSSLVLAAAWLPVGRGVGLLDGVGSHAALVQGWPFVPPAPPGSGCSSGSCRSFKVTPRRKLERKGTVELNKMKKKLQDEIAKLELEFAQSRRKQSQALGKLQNRLQALSHKSAKSQEAFSKDQEERMRELQARDEKITGSMDNATALGEEVEKNRGAMQSVRSALRSTLSAASFCDLTKCPELVLAVSEVRDSSTLQLGDEEVKQNTTARQARVPDLVKHQQLVRKVEALEEKLAKLEEDNQAAVIQNSVSQRELSDHFEDFRRKQFARDVHNSNAKQYLDAKRLRLRGHARTAKRYEDHQAEVAGRLEIEAATSGAKLQRLQAAMGECGC